MTKGKLTADDGSTDSRKSLTDRLAGCRLVTHEACDGTAYIRREWKDSDDLNRPVRVCDCKCLHCDEHFEKRHGLGGA